MLLRPSISLNDIEKLNEVNKKLEIFQILFEILRSNLSMKIFTKVIFLALVLNHKFKDKLLNSGQKFSSRYFLAKLLNDPGEFVKFEQYLKSKNEFQDEKLNNMDSKTFWTNCPGQSLKESALS